MEILSLDHLVLTVRDPAATIAFYRDLLGMEEVTFGAGRKALRFGRQKINLHPLGAEAPPVAARPTPGSADVCFLTATPIAEVTARLAGAGVEILEGPVERAGAVGPILSVYLLDPDGNLIEIANQLRP